MIFSKQKKTKISDTAYDESVFNGITDIGLSKNVLRDWIETHIASAIVHHTATVASDINLNDLAEKLHASLASVTASQHHTKYLDSEALAYINAQGLSLVSTKVIISAESFKFISDATVAV